MKAHLGQHILGDRQVIERLVSTLKIKPDDVFIEIGAGSGALTEPLCDVAGSVDAFEIDPRYRVGLQLLSLRFPNLRFHICDFMESDLAVLRQDDARPFRIAGNIPYYITAPIIKKLLDSPGIPITDITLTMQKEVAEKIVSSAGDSAFGSFSIFVQYHAEAKLLFPIPASSFRPRPAVDSAVLRLVLRKTPPVPTDEKTLFRIIRAAFSQRRKKVRNTLNVLFGERTEEILRIAAIDPSSRPQDLSLEDFARIADAHPGDDREPPQSTSQ